MSEMDRPIEEYELCAHQVAQEAIREKKASLQYVTMLMLELIDEVRRRRGEGVVNRP